MYTAFWTFELFELLVGLGTSTRGQYILTLYSTFDSK